MELGPRADSISNPMESLAIYTGRQLGRVVCKLTTDKFQGTKLRYRPDFREPYLYTLFVLHTFLHTFGIIGALIIEV